MQTRDEIIAAVRAAASKRGAGVLTKHAFCRATGIPDRRLYAHFASWREACIAAGVRTGANPGKVPTEAVFAAMRDAFLACGGIAAWPAFQREFRFSRSLMVGRQTGN